MAVGWTCTCGRALQIAPSPVARRTGCPFCGAVVVIPATPVKPAPSPWLIALVGAAVLLTGVAGYLIARRTPGERVPEEQETRRETPPPLDELPRSTEPTDRLKERPQTAEKEPSKPPPEKIPVEKLPLTQLPPEKPPVSKPPEKPPEPKPVVPGLEVVKVDPAEPKSGEKLSIQTRLSHPEGGKVRLQFRAGAEARWQDAPGDRIDLPKVTGPLFVLEMRAIDGGGKTSPVERRTWTLPVPMGKLVAVGEKVRLEWKLKKGDVFFQELMVGQKPAFSVLGIVHQSPLQYSVLSRFTVDYAGPDGYVVIQRVEKAQLNQADQLTQAALLPAVQKMPGTTYRIHLNAKMEMTRFVGGDARVQFAARAMPGGLGLQAASLMDLDGWREMAQCVFFRPLDEVAPRTNWVRPMTHNWGPLGAWVGQTLYLYMGRQANLHQFNYGHTMRHVPPRGGAGGGLPFQIAGAAFVPLEAAGQLAFDADKGRVMGGQERFRVRGRISIMLLGTLTPVDIEEEQTFQFRIVDTSPGVR